MEREFEPRRTGARALQSGKALRQIFARSSSRAKARVVEMHPRVDDLVTGARDMYLNGDKLSRRGKRLEDFQQGSAAFYQEHLKPHLAPNILRRVEHHRQQGHVLVLISRSIRYLLEPVAEDLGFHHFRLGVQKDLVSFLLAFLQNNSEGHRYIRGA